MITAIQPDIQEQVDELYRDQPSGNTCTISRHQKHRIETEAYSRLASGKRITNASDDAAGLFIAWPNESPDFWLERAVKNSFDGVSLVNTAEANLNEIRNMVLRMRELAVQMANGIYLTTLIAALLKLKLTN